jgi:hypothetical protein
MDTLNVIYFPDDLMLNGRTSLLEPAHVFERDPRSARRMEAALMEAARHFIQPSRLGDNDPASHPDPVLADNDDLQLV